MFSHPHLALMVLICLVSADVTGEDGWSPELSMQVATIDWVVPSPDGEWVAYTRTGAVMEKSKSEMVTQIHLARSDGSRRFQMTAGEESSTSPAFSPDSRYVYFLSRRSGERNIWRISLQGGEAQAITRWEGSIDGFQVAPDGSQIAFRGRKKDAVLERAIAEKLDLKVVGERPEYHYLWILAVDTDVKQREPVRIVDRETHVVDIAWSPDSSSIAFEHWPRPDADYWLQSDISEVEVESRTVRPIASNEVSERSPRYSPDGDWVAYVRSSHVKNWAGEGRIVIMDLAGRKSVTMPLTQDEFGRGSNLLGFSADSKRLLFTETQGTRNVLMSMTLDGEQRALGHPQSGTLARYGRGSQLNSKGTQIGFARESSREAVETYVLDLEGGDAKQVSEAHGCLPKPPLGRTEVIRWKSKDGLEIEGLLTYPVGYTKRTRVPLVLVVHGGPMGVFTQTFIGARGLYPLATFAEKGYAVLRPNPRGSSGYGKTFRMANFGDWGRGDYEDIMAGVDKVVEMGIADPKRMAVMGWSYGGFMTSWIIGQTERFQAACVGAAVTNLWSFTGTSDILDFLPGYFGAEPWENFDAYRKHSPMSFVQNVTTPALVLHGEQDVRVPASQGYEFYNALKRRGVDAKMVVYPRTPHGPREPKFILDIAKRHVLWVEQHVQ